MNLYPDPNLYLEIPYATISVTELKADCDVCCSEQHRSLTAGNGLSVPYREMR